MTVSLKHLFQSSIPDDPDTSIVRPSDWNAEHTLTLDTGKLLGRSSAGTGAAEEITVGTGLSLSGGTLSNSQSTTLTVGTTATSGGAAGQIMFDTGSVLQESSNLVWNNTNGGLTVSSIANPTIPSLTINGASNYTGTTLSGVSITGTGGQFSCDSTTLTVGEFVTISGTLGGTGTISGYANPTTYRISATNGTTTFTLVNNTTGAAIVTTTGTPTGLTYTVTDPFINLSQTWNNSVVAFRGLQYNVTDTASNASSLLMDLQVGGVSRARINKAGALFLPDGSNSTPTLASTASVDTGFVNNSNSPYITCGGNPVIRFSSGNSAWVDTRFGFTSGGVHANNPDTFLSRRGAANLRFGAADAAAPVAQTLSVQSVVAGTSNTAGANLTITGSQGTGTGAGGSIIFQVAPAGSSGTAQNALSTALTILPTGVTVASQRLQVTGNTAPTTGTGFEFGYNSVIPEGVMVVYDRGASVYRPFRIDALTVSINPTTGGAVSVGALSSTAAALSYNFAVAGTSGSNLIGEYRGAYSSSVGATILLYANAGSAITSGSRMGSLSFGAASSASALRNSAIITGFATENWVDTSAYGSRLEFGTTANGSTTRTTRLIIGNSGIITLGATEANTVPALKPSSTILQVRLADDSAYAPVEASTVRTAVAYTVATLPAAGTAGRRAYVTDATAPTWLGALTGGGAVVTPVFDNGTAWVAG